MSKKKYTEKDLNDALEAIREKKLKIMVASKLYRVPYSILVKKSRKNTESKRVFFKYTEQDMKQAYEAVLERKMKIREAARLYGVPHTTLIKKLEIKSNLERRMGPATKMSANDEKTLVQFLLASAEKGFPVSKKRLLILAQEVSGAPLGRKWLQLFLNRHKEVSVMYADEKEAARQGRMIERKRKEDEKEAGKQEKTIERKRKEEEKELLKAIDTKKKDTK